MKLFNIISVIAILSVSIAHAGTITVTRNGDDIARCTPVGPVQSSPPYLLPGGDLRDLKRQAAALRADTVLVTVRGIFTQGMAYRCQ